MCEDEEVALNCWMMNAATEIQQLNFLENIHSSRLFIMLFSLWTVSISEEIHDETIEMDMKVKEEPFEDAYTNIKSEEYGKNSKPVLFMLIWNMSL